MNGHEEREEGHSDLDHLAGRRGRGRRGRCWRYLASFTLAAMAACGTALAALLVASACSNAGSGPPKAAIVDQLSLTFPNQDFVDKATGVLEGAGHVVDYFPGEEVTVDLLRNLAGQHYTYVILRVHSTVELREANGATSTDEAFLFTGEPYSRTKYADERLGGYLVRTHYYENDQTYYYGIAPSFIASKIKGRFDGATVILMGCDSLKSDSAASAFVGKGAKAVIGWDGAVSAAHTDEATERLLHYLLVEDLAPSEAVARAMTDVGPDPSYGSKLALYPTEAAASSAP